jgi:hypothetical protein
MLQVRFGWVRASQNLCTLRLGRDDLRRPSLDWLQGSSDFQDLLLGEVGKYFQADLSHLPDQANAFGVGDRVKPDLAVGLRQNAAMLLIQGNAGLRFPGRAGLAVST